MDKGQRVRIVGGGKGVGMHGVVFWKGPNKWGPGERLGVRGDDGETYWVQDADVEAATGALPPPAGPTFAKGDRVAFQVGDRRGTGAVFWVGENRHGPGQRLGVRADDDPGDEAVWVDSRQVTPEAATEQGAPRSEEDDDGMPADYGAPVSLEDLPPAPPLPDDDADRWAAVLDADPEEGEV